MVTTKLYTAEDVLRLPADAPYELIRGELREVPPASMMPSVIAQRIGASFVMHLKPSGLGYVTGADGGFILSRRPDTVVAPDVGFVRAERLPNGIPEAGHCPIPPDLAVEVMSPSDTQRSIADKLRAYLDAGVLVWWVDLRRQVVCVHRPGQPVQELRAGDVLDGGEVLPGFRLPVAEIFG